MFGFRTCALTPLLCSRHTRARAAALTVYMGVGDVTDVVPSFEEFFDASERRLRQALSACLGSEQGRESAADAFAYAWEHWDRVGGMENPVGYLYVMARKKGRRLLGRRGPPALMDPDDDVMPWVEPKLVPALQSLSDRQRVAVMLIYCFQWSLSEVAELLGITKPSVQKHADRGLAHLRTHLGVEK